MGHCRHQYEVNGAFRDRPRLSPPLLVMRKPNTTTAHIFGTPTSKESLLPRVEDASAERKCQVRSKIERLSHCPSITAGARCAIIGTTEFDFTPCRSRHWPLLLALPLRFSLAVPSYRPRADAAPLARAPAGMPRRSFHRYRLVVGITALKRSPRRMTIAPR